MGRYYDVDDILCDLQTSLVPYSYGSQAPVRSVSVSPPDAYGTRAVTVHLRNAQIPEPLSVVLRTAAEAAHAYGFNINLFIEESTFGSQHHSLQQLLRNLPSPPLSTFYPPLPPTPPQRPKPIPYIPPSDYDYPKPIPYISPSDYDYPKPRRKWSEKTAIVLLLISIVAVPAYAITGNPLALVFLIGPVMVLHFFGVIH